MEDGNGAVNLEKKRKREETHKENREQKKKGKTVKYIGETSLSAYERLREHWNDYKNLSTKSHILKHYMDCHKDIPMDKMRFKMKIIQRYRNTFERQIGE